MFRLEQITVKSLVRGVVANDTVTINYAQMFGDQVVEVTFADSGDERRHRGVAASRTGNWFLEHDFLLCRLDKLSRNEDIQAQLKAVAWDLVIVDETHKMSANFFGGEVKTTKRFNLGRLLSDRTVAFNGLEGAPQ